MTDAGRKDFSSKASEKMTPDSQKSTLDKMGETITGAGDKASRDMVPDSQKSTSQSVGDKASRQKDHSSNESTMDKVKDTMGMNKN